MIHKVASGLNSTHPLCGFLDCVERNAAILTTEAIILRQE